MPLDLFTSALDPWPQPGAPDEELGDVGEGPHERNVQIGCRKEGQGQGAGGSGDGLRAPLFATGGAAQLAAWEEGAMAKPRLAQAHPWARSCDR